MAQFPEMDAGDLRRAKRVMIERHLKGRDISDPAVLRAMEEVPREEFVHKADRELAYADNPLPIGCGQTISQPYIVALMAQKLRLKKTDRVLEVGCGSGYQAAALSRLCAQVYTTEIVEGLAVEAAGRLARLGYANVAVRHCDGSLGWPEEAPFDKIIAAATARRTPKALEEQLAEGGLIILPVGAAFVQDLMLGEKRGGRIVYEAVTSVRFVPMTGAAEEL